MGKRGKGKPQLNKPTQQTAIRPAPTSSMSVIEQMYQQYNPTAFGPNAPLAPYPSMQPKYGPRQYDYPIATNLNLAIRDGFTPFEVLRQFAGIYDGIALCLQGWYDCVANLEPSFEPVPGLLDEDEDITKYASDIAKYEEFFESPDKQLSIHEWMNAALNDMAVIDAVCIYPRLTYSGDLYALDLIDGATIKPLIDDRGRVPLPPAYAYEQIDYGVPSGTYTTDQLIYLKEHSRTNSMFGFSRVEAVLMRVNQALRKQNFDLSKFTDGNIPAGWLSPRADIGWTPENLAAYQTLLDNLMAGNDMLRSRVKVAPPGSTYTQTSPMELMTDLDKFLLTVCCGSFGVMLPELGFTETVNRSSGETQEAVTYRRTLRPIAKKFERLFTHVLRTYFNEQRFMFRFKGYEEAEDFQMLSTAHTALVAAGIETAGAAARAMKLGDQGPDVPRFIMTPSGPFVIDDLANAQLRTAQVKAQMAGLQQATTTQDDKEEDATSQGAVAESGGESASSSESSPDEDENENNDAKRGDKAAKGENIQRVATSDEGHTGMMVAFFLDNETAQALAVPDGEPVSDLHVTLAYLGDTSDYTGDIEALKSLVGSVAATSQPLLGKVSGLGRFTPSESSDGMAPIYASVDVQGLQQFREALVQQLASIGCETANNFAYTPHITLMYIDDDAPVPIKNIPTVPLDLNTLWLAIGDERYAYPMGKSNQDVARVALARTDLRKWRDMAISRVKAGKPLRTFVSAHISSGLIERVQSALADCTTPDEVRMVFAGVGDHQLIGADGDVFTRVKKKTWHAPTDQQLAIEGKMKHAITEYVHSVIDADMLTTRLLALYEDAATLGRETALKHAGKMERLGPLSGLSNLLGRVRDVVTSITTFTVSSGSDETTQSMDDYAEMLSETEIQATVQQGQLDIYNQYGLPVQWVTEPGACPVCNDNADYGIIAAGNSFPSGDDAPPAHPRCRCHLATADGYEPE